MASTEPRNLIAPYGPWSSFTSFVKGLNGSIIPPVIDSSLMTTLSGSAASQLRAALRFLSLVQGDNDAVTDRFRSLVASSADGEQWRDELSRLIPSAYASVTNGIDLLAGTRAQLDEAFRERGNVQGSSKEKAIRFFLSAMTDAGLAVSPHFGGGSSGRARSNGRTKSGARRQGQRKMNGDSEETQDPHPASVGRVPITCSIPNGRTIQVSLPGDLSPAEEQFLVTYLDMYFKLGRNEQ